MSSDMTQKSDPQDAWERSPGYVYFMAAGNPCVAIKIGITKQATLRQRLGSLQGSNHEPLTLLGVIPFAEGKHPMKDAQRKERELHGLFAHLQRFEKGWVGSEWFTPAPDLRSFIAEHAEAPETLGLVESIARPGPGLKGPA